MASGSDPTCRVRCVYSPHVKERIDREILATCIIYRGAVFIHTPTCCGMLCWLVYSTCCQNENQTDEDIEARHYSLRGYVETHGTTGIILVERSSRCAYVRVNLESRKNI